MNELGNKIAVFLQREQPLRILRKSIFFYLLVFFIVGGGLDLELVHLFRGFHMRSQYAIIPLTREWGAQVMVFDYYVHLNPDDPEGWAELGMSYFLIGDIAGAERAYREAVRLRQFHGIPKVSRAGEFPFRSVR